MAKTVRHLHVVVPLKFLDKRLDALAKDDWTLLTSSPMNANAAELGEEALVLCILSKEIKL